MRIGTSAVLPVLAFAATLCAASGRDSVGETTYLDGTVDVFRAGAALTPADVDIGMEVENYDILRTGNDGTVEVTLTAGPSPDTAIRVDPNTSFTIEIGSVRSRPQTTVNMIAGTIGLKVKRVAGAAGVQVRTESTVMSVRGTDFTVTAPAGGELLILCSEGEVSCVDEGGSELMARPGVAVEKIPGQSFRTVPVAVSSLEEFRRSWLAERIEALRANALRATQGLAPRYGELSRQFAEQYRDLMKEASLLDTWADEDLNGRTPPATSARAMIEKKRIVGTLFKLRATLFTFERVYFRVAELEQYHDEGLGRGKLADGTSTDDFFTRVAAERSQLARRLSLVQLASRLYANRNDGEFPGGILGGAGDSDDGELADDDFGSEDPESGDFGSGDTDAHFDLDEDFPADEMDWD